jgi:hypothetical protein
MITRNKLDAISGTAFLFLALVIVLIIVPEAITFLTNQLGITLGVFIFTFLVALLQKKVFK